MRLTLGRVHAPRPGESWLATVALLILTFMAVGFSPRAEAAIAKDIVDADTGTILGSIILPAATGSSPAGVSFQITAGGIQFTEADITSLSWDFESASPSLSLNAATGDIPCDSPDDGPCTKNSLMLTLDSLSTGVMNCPPPPPPMSQAICTGSATIPIPIEFVDAVPAYACRGFGPPLAEGPVTAQGNRVLPLKAELLDPDGSALTDDDFGAPPVLQVHYRSGVAAPAADVSHQALWIGQGTKGNAFEFSGSKWRFNLKIRNYTAPGTYTVTIISGDEAAYRVDPTCEAQFIIEP